MPTEDPRYDVRHPEAEALLRKLGRMITEIVAEVPGYGFGLFIFQYGPGGNMFWISNAERESILAAMEEFIERERKKMKTHGANA